MSFVVAGAAGAVLKWLRGGLDLLWLLLNFLLRFCNRGNPVTPVTTAAANSGVAMF